MPEQTFDEVTIELRVNGWYPAEKFWCGCNPDQLCEGHAVCRAVEHYYPEEAR